MRSHQGIHWVTRYPLKQEWTRINCLCDYFQILTENPSGSISKAKNKRNTSSHMSHFYCSSHCYCRYRRVRKFMQKLRFSNYFLSTYVRESSQNPTGCRHVGLKLSIPSSDVTQAHHNSDTIRHKHCIIITLWFALSNIDFQSHKSFGSFCVINFNKKSFSVCTYTQQTFGVFLITCSHDRDRKIFTIFRIVCLSPRDRNSKEIK